MENYEIPVFNEIRVHSFDVFDTCITRVYANPRDIFFVLGERLSVLLSKDGDRLKFARKFQRARILAEKIINFRARLNKSSSTNIFSIYDVFQYLCKTGMSTQELVAAEVSLECECIYPISKTVVKINNARASGGKIVFVSDMYIPGELLAPILQHHGILRDGDALYVSCDYGVSKYSGHLFDHVLREEKIRAVEILHTGDNFHADVLMAKKRGMHAEYFCAAHLSRHEKNICGVDKSPDMNKSWLAAFSRRCRLSASDEVVSHADSFEMIHAVVIPFLLTYVVWIIEHAKSNGIKKLYFVARDGEILHRMAKELCSADGEIEIFYLHGSRRAWLAPSIVSDSLDWHKMLMFSGNKKSPADIADQIGLDEVEKERLRRILGFGLERWDESLDYGAVQVFYAELINNHEVSVIVKNSSERKRNAMRIYLQQQGLLSEDNWAIVDAGWSLSSQAALKRVLDIYSPGIPVRGYYIGLSKDHLSANQAGQSFALIPQPGSLFSRRRVVLEHCCLPSTHASTVGYQVTEGIAQPVFGEETREIDELSYARQLHDAGAAAANLVAKDREIYRRFLSLKSAAVSNVSGIIQNPDEKDLTYLSQFGVIAEIRHNKEFLIPLCRSLYWRDVGLLVAAAFLKKKKVSSPSYMWLEGSAAMSPVCKKIMVKIMLQADIMKNKIFYRS